MDLNYFLVRIAEAVRVWFAQRCFRSYYMNNKAFSDRLKAILRQLLWLPEQ